MHLLYCDESNMQERAGDFLIYGGVVIDGVRAHDLSGSIEEIRLRHGLSPSFRLKFNPGPPHLSHAQFIELKESVIRTAVEHGAQLIAYVVLHDLARNPDLARRNGINTVCYHFHCILNRLRSHGLVLIDRFADEQNEIEAHLRDKFSVGLTGLPYAGELRLSNILGFHYAAVGQSHFPSLIDILLGSLRFAVNANSRGQEGHRASAMTLLRLLSPLFFRERGNPIVSELGFQFSPKIVRAAGYRLKYQSLKDFLAEGGVTTEQPITSVRQY